METCGTDTALAGYPVADIDYVSVGLRDGGVSHQEREHLDGLSYWQPSQPTHTIEGGRIRVSDSSSAKAFA